MTLTDMDEMRSNYRFYDGDKKVLDLPKTVVGEVLAFSDDLIVGQRGVAYSVYDSRGTRLTQFSINVVGDFRRISGDTVLFERANRVSTYDLKGRKLGVRTVMG